ncbi:hypothetical protein C0431_02710 [bacterium]|nr:hypothetical protein [bacterium]
MAIRLAPYPESTNANLYLIHGGPGAQGSLHGLNNSLPEHLNSREILQRYSGEVSLTVDQHIADMREIISKPANILGHSWGAMLTLSFAAKYPQLCRQIILVGCGTYSTTSRREYERRIALRTDPRIKALLKQAIQEAKTPDEHELAFRNYGEYATKIQAYNPIADPFPDHITKWDPIGHSETWSDVMRLQEERIEPQRFNSITCPVNLIQGAQDPHPGELIRNDLLPYIPQLQYIELDQCGHEPWLERNARIPFLSLVENICR